MSIYPSASLFLTVAVAVGQAAEVRRTVDPRDVIALEEGVCDAVITIPSRIKGEAPTIATGVQVNELRSGGLWMLNRMSVNGGAYQGTGIWGSDPTTGRYSGSWVDDGTARLRMDEGDWDSDTNTMSWKSNVERHDGRQVKMRATSTFSGRTRTYRSFAITDAGDVPLSIVVFTRRVDAAPQQ